MSRVIAPEYVWEVGDDSLTIWDGFVDSPPNAARAAFSGVQA